MAARPLSWLHEAPRPWTAFCPDPGHTEDGAVWIPAGDASPRASLALPLGVIMKLSIEHTHSGWLPFKRLTFLEIAERLHQRLTSILSTELAWGNLIYEAIEGEASVDDAATSRREVGERSRTSEDRIRVLLLHPFKKRHDLQEGVVFIDGEPGTHDSRGPEYRATSDTKMHVLVAPI